MKNTFKVFLFAAVFMMLASAAQAGGNKVTVSNAKEFLNAIKDNAVIVLKPGVYDVTEALQSANMPFLNDAHLEGAKGVFRSSGGDGLELSIRHISNLTIKSENPSKRAQIVCRPRYAVVMSFHYCDNVKLENVIVGHTPEPGYCSGSVLGFTRCKGIEVNHADLYGCGTYGFELADCSNATFRNCCVHDCTYGCVTIASSKNINIVDTTFKDCREFTMFGIFNSDTTFKRCSFERLNGKFIAADNSNVVMEGCLFDINAANSLIHNEWYMKTVTVK